MIVAVDIGVRNLGVCAYDPVAQKVVHWENHSMVSGRYLPKNNVAYVRDFALKHADLFANADVVLIERQMRVNMRVIEALFELLFYDKCHVVSPRSVKSHFRISTGAYAANKKLAIDRAVASIASKPEHFADECREAFDKARKKDDMADALLMVLYYLDTYSNPLCNHAVHAAFGLSARGGD